MSWKGYKVHKLIDKTKLPNKDNIACGLNSNHYRFTEIWEKTNCKKCLKKKEQI